MPKAVNASTGIEGGEFKCDIHGDGNTFVTSDANEWYDHLESKDENGKPTHFEEGSSDCVFCHAPNIKFKLPYTRPGKVKGAVCDNCRESQFGGSQ